MPASASPFLALFTLVGLVLVLSVLDAWLGTVRMQVRPGRLVVTRRILGIGRTRVLGPDDLADLAIEANGHVGSKVFYALRARRAGRKRRSTLVSGFDERAQAERTREIVQRALAGDREAG